MTETQTRSTSPAAAPSDTAGNKLALSRALGAAFLNHQVQQLEKSVATRPRHEHPQNGRMAPARADNSPASRNWRDRPAQAGPVTGAKTSAPHAGTQIHPSQRNARPTKKKDADVVVVDASVLIHAPHQLKRWCKDTSQETIIIPLEALNTLDLLKKGTTVLAAKARAASRTLEAQVGVNPRINVQHDDAFIKWNDITLKEDTAESKETSAQSTCPDWVRHTISCAAFETAHPSANNAQVDDHQASLRVVLAVLAPSDVADPPEWNAANNKYESRSSGSHVREWATRAGIQLLQVEPSSTGRTSPEESTTYHHHNGGSRKFSGGAGGAGARAPAPRSVAQGQGRSPPRVPIVERPPTVNVAPGRPIRLLARGEKLEVLTKGSGGGDNAKAMTKADSKSGTLLPGGDNTKTSAVTVEANGAP